MCVAREKESARFRRGCSRQSLNFSFPRFEAQAIGAVEDRTLNQEQ
jgi:hypothetical protein